MEIGGIDPPTSRKITSDTGNRTRGDWVRARHVTYYTISENAKPNVGIEPTTSCSVGRRATIAPVRLMMKEKQQSFLAGNRTRVSTVTALYTNRLYYEET